MRQGLAFIANLCTGQNPKVTALEREIGTCFSIVTSSPKPLYKWRGVTTLDIIVWNLHHMSMLGWGDWGASILGLPRIELLP